MNNNDQFPADPQKPLPTAVSNEKTSLPADNSNYKNEENDTSDEDNFKKATLDNSDTDGDPLNESSTPDDLDIPGSEDDDNEEKIGEEDEENDYFSLGGDDHNELEEDQG